LATIASESNTKLHEAEGSGQIKMRGPQ